MTKKEEIRELLSQGVSKPELLRRGYSRGTVYKTGRELRREGSPPSNKPTAGNSDPKPAVSPGAATPAPDLELSDLQRQIQRVKLEGELKRLRGDVKSVEELAREVALLREWTVGMVCSLGQAIEHLAGNGIDRESFEEFERQALQDLRGGTSKT